MVVAADGRPAAELAGEVSARGGVRVDADDIRFLAERKLAPVGVVDAGLAQPAPPPPRARSALGLRLRTRVVPARAVQTLATALAPLFWPPLVLAVVGGLVALDTWLLATDGLAGLAPLLLDPAAMAATLAVLLASAAVHECGHAAACRYGGGRPGAIGAGVFLVWPAFFSDVTDAYRLGRAGRVRTDLGGVYFNALAVLVIAAAWALTGHPPLLLAAVLAQLEMLRQLVPLPRLDGYYLLSDLAGVPDVLGRVGPALAGIVRRGGVDPRGAELRPAAQAAVAAYAVALVPMAGAVLTLLALAAPGWARLAMESAGREGPAIAAAVTRLDPAATGAGAARLVLALLPVVGLALLVGGVGRRLGATLARRLAPAAALVWGGVAAATLAALVALVSLPSAPPPPPAGDLVAPRVPAPTPAPPGPPDLSVAEARALNDVAYGLMLEGDHARAVAPLRRAVAALEGAGPADPFEAYANYNLGASLLELGRCAEARPPLLRSDRLQDRVELDRALARVQLCRRRGATAGVTRRRASP